MKRDPYAILMPHEQVELCVRWMSGCTSLAELEDVKKRIRPIPWEDKWADERMRDGYQKAQAVIEWECQRLTEALTRDAYDRAMKVVGGAT